MFTACLLARAGLRARVFEGAGELDPRPRTLIVTRRLQEILGEVGKSALVNEIRRVELFTDGRVATIALERPDLVIERAKLIRALAEGAKQAGAEVLLGRRFVSLDQSSLHAARRQASSTMERTGGDVYLVGDAAGHVKVTTVGGIVSGFRGVVGVAEAILNGGRSPKLSVPRRELDLHLVVRKIMHRFSQAEYSQLVDLLNRPARR